MAAGSLLALLALLLLSIDRSHGGPEEAIPTRVVRGYDPRTLSGLPTEAPRGIPPPPFQGELLHSNARGLENYTIGSSQQRGHGFRGLEREGSGRRRVLEAEEEECWKGVAEGWREGGDGSKQYVRIAGQGCRRCSLGHRCSFILQIASPIIFNKPSNYSLQGRKKGRHRNKERVRRKGRGRRKGGSNETASAEEGGARRLLSHNRQEDVGQNSSSYNGSDLKSAAVEGEHEEGVEVIPRDREIMAILTGPTKHVAKVVPYEREPGGSRFNVSFEVSYRVWDAGEYEMEIFSDCSMGPIGDFGYHTIAKLSISIVISAKKNAAQRAPCSVGQFGRWVDSTLEDGVQRKEEIVDRNSATSKWKFQSYNCGGQWGRSVSEFVRGMHAKGVKEIFLVGDSMTRVLAHHLHFLMAGPDPEPVKKHGPFHVWEITDPSSNLSVRLNWTLIDGIYVNGEHGCSKQGLYTNATYRTLVVVPETADLIVMGAGTWTASLCERWDLAYSKHVPEFVDFVLSQPRKPTARVLWRSTPPYAVRRIGCFVHNSAIHWMNAFARRLLKKRDVTYMDFWPIEAPRYLDTCRRQDEPGRWVKDLHYSCIHSNMQSIHGDVGEAVVRVFEHYLLL